MHAPIKTLWVKNRTNLWVTPDLLTLMYARDYLNKKAIQLKDHTIWQQYRKVRNSVVHAINNAQRVYYRDQVNVHSGNKTNINNNINNVMLKALKHIISSDKPNYTNCIHVDIMNTLLILVPIYLINCLMSPIYGICLALYTHIGTQFSWSGFYNFFFLNYETVDSKSLRIGASAIAPSHTALINKSIQSDKLPDDWKIARVTPMYKGKGSTFGMLHCVPLFSM